jgi:hypothetical protein
LRHRWRGGADNAEFSAVEDVLVPPIAPISLNSYEALSAGMFEDDVWAIIPRNACKQSAKGAADAAVYECSAKGGGMMQLLFAGGALRALAQVGLTD